ncbi:penicillin-binding protein 2 [Patescibacteria group bacterium]|nr:penicillin-binding protein 2 [Patescibacteria group bacterium]
MANRQYFVSPAQYFDRGSIFFESKDGEIVSAATIKEGCLLAINPTLLEDPEDAYNKISQIIDLDKDLFFKSADKKGDNYEEVAHKISKEKGEEIMNLNLKGINIYSERWRYYPGNEMASRLLGFVGYNEDKLEGRYGLEKYYDRILSRIDGEGSIVNSFAEIIMDIKKVITGDSIKGDIVLTIDPEVQSFLEDNLKSIYEKYEAEMAGGIIIDPQTGKILAMSIEPGFNPNFYGEEKSLSVFLNPITQSVFEMGSIMKPLTLAAALDQNKITPQMTYDDKGYVILNNKKIENYDGKARGVVAMQEILNQSLNTGAVYVMQKLGKEEFKNYVINYGLGEKTGIDLPDEISGLISNLNSDRDIEFATASFGQGIAVTPIEMASALATLANGGVLIKPYIVERIETDEGISKKTETREKRRVLKEETSEEISRMLSKVFDEALMGGIYKMDRYSVAAKTGTAQVNIEGVRGYEEDQYIHTFFGYAPAFGARFLTFLFLVKPQGVKYASHSLSEPFVNITKFLLNYYQVPPDR